MDMFVAVGLISGCALFGVGALVNLSITGHPREHWSERVGLLGMFLVATFAVVAFLT